MKKRKYTRRPMNLDRIIKEITTIRTRNNKIWMKILHLAFLKQPKKAGKERDKIGKNDQDVIKWMARLPSHPRHRQ